MTGFLVRFWKDRSGATAIEYGLIGVLIAVAIITGATSIGTAVNNMLHTDTTKVTNAGS
jgi:pilus assembly protein Flp/PilA